MPCTVGTFNIHWSQRCTVGSQHGLVENAEDYPFCSYRWFLEKTDKPFQNTVMNQPIDRVNVFDDFD